MIDTNALADEILEDIGYEDIAACGAEFAARVPESDLRDVISVLSRDLFRARIGLERRSADKGTESAGQPLRGPVRRPQRKKGGRRAEMSGFVHDFCVRWLNSKSGVSGDQGYKRRGDFTAQDWLESAAWKSRQANTYARQATADEQIAALMGREFAATADELSNEGLFAIIKSYDDDSAELTNAA